MDSGLMAVMFETTRTVQKTAVMGASQRRRGVEERAGGITS